jgi:DNA-binding transcriptional LysR family regulator
LTARKALSRTLVATKRLLTEAAISPGRTMELHTREMIREGVAHGLGVSLMFERECPPVSRIRILPIESRSGTVQVQGYLAIRTERRRMPLMKAALKVAAEMRVRT